MNENKFANKKTDAEWISALFTEDMTDRQKYNKLSNLFFMTNNSGYCDSMAGELTKRPVSGKIYENSKTRRDFRAYSDPQ